MRFCLFVSVVATILLACVVGASMVTAANSPDQVRHVIKTKDGIPTKRLYNTSEPMDENDEARAGTSFFLLWDFAKLRLWTAKEKTDAWILRTLKGMDPIDLWLKHPKVELMSKILFGPTKSIPDSQETLVTVLLEADTEKYLAQTLCAMSHSGSGTTQKVAKELSMRLFKTWLDKNRTPVAICNILRSKGDNYQAISDTNRKVLDGYINLYNQGNLPVTLIDTFAEAYGGQGKFLNFLISAKSTGGPARKDAEYMESLLVTQWQQQHLRPITVLQGLQIGTALENLQDLKMTTVVKYIDIFNKDNPHEQFSLVKLFAKHYGDAKVADSILNAGHFLKTKDYTKRLGTDLASLWLENEKPVKDMLTMLKIREDKSMVDKLHILSEYRRLFREKNPEEILPNWFEDIREEIKDDFKFAILIWTMKDQIEWLKPYPEFLFLKWSQQLKPVEVTAKLEGVSSDKRDLADLINNEYSNFCQKAHSHHTTHASQIVGNVFRRQQS